MRVLRIVSAGAILAALCACGGGGGSIFNPNPGGGNTALSCDPGTSVQIARPAPGSYASNVSNIEIVASGNSNALYNSYQSWNVSVVNQNTGQTFPGNNLSPASDKSGPHPFLQDFYYNSQLNGTLPAGNTWNVLLYQNNYGGYGGACQPYQIGSFST